MKHSFLLTIGIIGIACAAHQNSNNTNDPRLAIANRLGYESFTIHLEANSQTDANNVFEDCGFEMVTAPQLIAWSESEKSVVVLGRRESEYLVLVAKISTFEVLDNDGRKYIFQAWSSYSILDTTRIVDLYSDPESSFFVIRSARNVGRNYISRKMSLYKELHQVVNSLTFSKEFDCDNKCLQGTP